MAIIIMHDNIYSANLCDYVTEDSGRGSNPSKQGVSIMSTTDQVETQGFKDAAKKIGSEYRA